MKRLILFFGIILVAAPLFAQEGGGDLGFGGMFGMGDAPRGGNTPVVDRLVSLRKILADTNVPLTKDQEGSLSKMLEADIKKYTTDLEKKYPKEVAEARAATAAAGDRGGRGAAGGPGGGAGDRRAFGGQPGAGQPGGDNAQGRGGGGRGGARGSVLPPNSPLIPEMNRINAELQNKVTTSLKPEQQAAFSKYQNDQVKKAGGFGALKLTLQESGAALSPDQETQIQALYADEGQQRRQLMMESQGQPDKAKLDALSSGTMLKVVKVLNADQKKLFLDSLKKQQQQH